MDIAGSPRVFALSADRAPPIANPCDLRLDGDGLMFSVGGAGNTSKEARGEDRKRSCADRSLLLVHWKNTFRKIIGIYRNF